MLNLVFLYAEILKIFVVLTHLCVLLPTALSQNSSDIQVTANSPRLKDHGSNALINIHKKKRLPFQGLSFPLVRLMADQKQLLNALLTLCFAAKPHTTNQLCQS